MQKLREPGSAITHFIGMLSVTAAAVPLMIRAGHTVDRIQAVSVSVFILSMILLYAASATYHSVMLSERMIRIFRKIDHMMIFVLIAGSYTPVCVIVLGGRTGYTMLAVVWGLALIGIIVKACWITCPKWFSSVIYIGLGWACIFAFSQIKASLSPSAFGWLLAGGVIYTVGGVIYALKLPLFNSKHANFGSHEIFHLFVMGGSLCHFIFMYQILAGAPIR